MKLVLLLAAVPVHVCISICVCVCAHAFKNLINSYYCTHQSPYIHGAGVISLSAVKRITALKGGSVSIPCLYLQQYRRHVKYWCRGASWAFCSTVKKSNSPQEGSKTASVSDDTAGNVFTVTMRDLKWQDQGWYWCAVEIVSAADYGYYLHLTITDGDVKNGKGATAGIWGVGMTVSATDDRAGVFTVTMKKLSHEDQGWYRCATDMKTVPLYLKVLEGLSPNASGHHRASSCESHAAARYRKEAGATD
ncbi:CMRF35-like molecule 5 [Amia ocellicauda]|uniref:CMRF35-like molecule 5 n=1 Tax=Amia ocellicauda TaxID=2972642 RepID=UPI0034641772